MLADKINKAVEIISAVRAMPKVHIEFSRITEINHASARRMYRFLTKRHRLLVFANKSIGVALVDLKRFQNIDDYLKNFNGKNSAAYYSRKAIKRGYSFKEINRNKYVDEIHRINISAEFRGGKKMSDWYTNYTSEYEDDPAYKYFGVIDSDGELVAYCHLGIYGEFSILTVLLGHKDHLNNGIMYFMIISVIRYLYEHRLNDGCRYLMYDTMLGAGKGLQSFKYKLGFMPYRVKWKWKGGSPNSILS